MVYCVIAPVLSCSVAVIEGGEHMFMQKPTRLVYADDPAAVSIRAFESWVTMFHQELSTFTGN